MPQILQVLNCQDDTFRESLNSRHTTSDLIEPTRNWASPTGVRPARGDNPDGRTSTDPSLRKISDQIINSRFFRLILFKSSGVWLRRLEELVKLIEGPISNSSTVNERSA